MFSPLCCLYFYILYGVLGYVILYFYVNTSINPFSYCFWIITPRFYKSFPLLSSICIWICDPIRIYSGIWCKNGINFVFFICLLNISMLYISQYHIFKFLNWFVKSHLCIEISMLSWVYFSISCSIWFVCIYKQWYHNVLIIKALGYIFISGCAN